MSIATVVTGGYGNGVFEATIAEVTLDGYTVNPVVLEKTPRKMTANITKRLHNAEANDRLTIAESTKRRMEA